MAFAREWVRLIGLKGSVIQRDSQLSIFTPPTCPCGRFLLLGSLEGWRWGLCQDLCCVPARRDQVRSTCQLIRASPYSRKVVREHLYGFHHGITHEWGVQLGFGNSRSMLQLCHLRTCTQRMLCRASLSSVLQTGSQILGLALVNSEWPGHSLCGAILNRVT